MVVGRGSEEGFSPEELRPNRAATNGKCEFLTRSMPPSNKEPQLHVDIDRIFGASDQLSSRRRMVDAASERPKPVYSRRKYVRLALRIERGIIFENRVNFN